MELSPGRAIVYTAESVALAVLENLVNMSRVDFPTGYVITGVWIPDHVAILPEPHVRPQSPFVSSSEVAIGSQDQASTWIGRRRATGCGL